MFAAQGTWDAILVAELEKNISQTRGAIFYFNKNKSDLFVNMIDELFFPVFALSDNEKARLAVFNVIIQAQKHYTGFSAVLKAAMENELSFIAEKHQSLVRKILRGISGEQGSSIMKYLLIEKNWQ